MTRNFTKAVFAAALVLMATPGLASAAGKLAASPPPALGINCSGEGKKKSCLCRGLKSCRKLANNCATKLQGGRAPSGGIYGKCNNVLNTSPLGLSAN